MFYMPDPIRDTSSKLPEGAAATGPSLPPIPEPVPEGRSVAEPPLPVPIDDISELRPPTGMAVGAEPVCSERAAVRVPGVLGIRESNAEKVSRWTRTKRWLKEAYSTHLKASYESAGCAIFSFGVGTVAAAILQKSLGSSPTSIMAAYASGLCAYWGTFLPILAYGERGQFRNELGEIDGAKTVAKLKEYGTLFVFTELVFGTLRVGSMNALVHWGRASTLQAQVSSFIALNAIYFGILPPLRHALQRYFLGEGKSRE